MMLLQELGEASGKLRAAVWSGAGDLRLQVPREVRPSAIKRRGRLGALGDRSSRSSAVDDRFPWAVRVAIFVGGSSCSSRGGFAFGGRQNRAFQRTLEGCAAVVGTIHRDRG